MPDVAWLLTALACAALGLAWLALAMDVHWVQACGSRARSRTRVFALRFLGWSAITGSLLLCLAADTPTMAVLVWMMFTATSAFGIACLLSWRPRLLAPLATPLAAMAEPSGPAR